MAKEYAIKNEHSILYQTPCFDENHITETIPLNHDVFLLISGNDETIEELERKLEEAKKIYDTDVSFNSIRVTDGHYDLTHNLENIVYNELLYRDYQLTVYDNNGKEVDFLAEKDNKKYYVQVAYSVLEKKAYDREFSAFNHLSQVDMKILITNDELDYSTSNVKHIRLKEFLRNGLE